MSLLLLFQNTTGTGPATLTKLVSANAVLSKTLAKTVTANAVLQTTLNKSVIADSVIQRTLTLTSEIAAVVLAALSKTVTVDAHIVTRATITSTVEGTVAVRQFARPASDVAAGNYTTSSGSGSLSSHIDEAEHDDADYIESGTLPDTTRVTLSAISQPEAGTVYLRVRMRNA